MLLQVFTGDAGQPFFVGDICERCMHCLSFGTDSTEALNIKNHMEPFCLMASMRRLELLIGLAHRY